MRELSKEISKETRFVIVLMKRSSQSSILIFQKSSKPFLKKNVAEYFSESINRNIAIKQINQNLTNMTLEQIKEILPTLENVEFQLKMELLFRNISTLPKSELSKKTSLIVAGQSEMRKL